MSTAQQEIKSRQSYLGCSELGAVMGVDPYKTALDVFNQKLGLVEPFQGNRHTERGEKLEAIAAQEYTEKTGRSLRRRNEALVHQELAFFRGHIDRLVVGQERIAEIKCPSQGSFARIKREGPPVSWILQLQGYLLLSGKSAGEYIVFNADQWELLTFEVAAEPALYPSIEAAARDFWNHVLSRTPPPPVAADKAKFEFERVSGEVVMRTDREFATAAEELFDAYRLRKDAESLYDLAKDRLKVVVGGLGKFEGAGLRLHYAMQEGRRTFDQKALARAHPELDLEAFFKTGSPFEVFKPVFLE